MTTIADSKDALRPLSEHVLNRTPNTGYVIKVKKRWVAFRHRWESEEELLRVGPSKSEYFILLLFYQYLYLLSGFLHELGHMVGAMFSGTPIVAVMFSPTVFSVSINSFGRHITFVRILGGVFQGMFFLLLSRRYRPLYLVSFSCFVYAIAEVYGCQVLMIICAVLSEIVGCLIVICLAF